MRILTGIQPSGKLHWGNYFGAMKSMFDLQAKGEDMFMFIANFHAMTTVRDGATLREATREVARHLKMLLLVLPDRHKVRVHDKDVSRHQHRIREKSMRRLEAVRHLVLVTVATLKKPHRSEARKVPREFLHLGNIALAVNRRLRRVEPAREIVKRHFARRFAEHRTVAHSRHRVEIRDEHEHVLALRLKVEHRLHRAKIIAPMKLARRLYSRQNSHGKVLYQK